MCVIKDKAIHLVSTAKNIDTIGKIEDNDNDNEIGKGLTLILGL